MGLEEPPRGYDRPGVLSRLNREIRVPFQLPRPHKLWGGRFCPQPPFRRLFRGVARLPRNLSRVNLGEVRPLSAILVCGVAGGLLALPAPFFAAARKKPASSATPSPAARAAALKRVNAALDDPPDEWTGGLREEIQQRFGNGGSGFSLAGRPFLGYRRFDIRGGGSALWHSEGLRTGAGDGFYGLGGVSIETTRAGQSVYARGECDSLEVDYLVQPGGGAVAVYVDEERRDEFSTDGVQMAPGAVRYDLSPGLHTFKVVTLEPRPVRLFYSPL